MSRTKLEQKRLGELNTRRLLTVGILFLFGGDAFSLLGPMRFEHTVHFVGHVVFYAGFGVVTHLQ